jgi:hypothetical protein
MIPVLLIFKQWCVLVPLLKIIMLGSAVTGAVEIIRTISLERHVIKFRFPKLYVQF